MKTATILALVGAALAEPVLEQRQTTSINALAASLALFQALPTSLQQLALTNEPAASSIIAAEFASGTPSWYSNVPPAIQTYLLTASAALVSEPAQSTGGFNTTIVSGGVLGNSTATIANGTVASTHASSTGSAAAKSASAAASSAAKSASSAAAASATSSAMAAPTQVIAGGLVGAVGVIAMLAL